MKFERVPDGLLLLEFARITTIAYFTLLQR